MDYTAQQIADAMKIVEAVKQERGKKKYAEGWQYKEALEYLCENVLGMKHSDIWTSTKLRYKLADGTYWYGTGKWPKEMTAHVEALIAADPKLKKSDARQQTKQHYSKEDRAAPRKLTDEEMRAAVLKKQDEVKAFAKEVAGWFSEHFEDEQVPEQVVEQVPEKPVEKVVRADRPGRPVRRDGGQQQLAN